MDLSHVLLLCSSSLIFFPLYSSETCFIYLSRQKCVLAQLQITYLKTGSEMKKQMKYKQSRCNFTFLVPTLNLFMSHSIKLAIQGNLSGKVKILRFREFLFFSLTLYFILHQNFSSSGLGFNFNNPTLILPWQRGMPQTINTMFLFHVKVRHSLNIKM